MSLTTDPNHPDLKKGVDTQPVPQNKTYLVLSEEERAKGFVRPYRDSYVHVGDQPKYPLRDLTESEKVNLADEGYVKYEEYPDNGSGVTGRYWTQKRLDAKGCGALTTMARQIAETYARDPYFYGATYCTGCRMHLPLAEFVWDGTDIKVGT